MLLAALCAGCAGRMPEVVDVRDVSSASSRPAIAEVLDLGRVGIPNAGPLSRSAGDGHAVIGELVLVRGSNFGKQPTVTVDGVAAQVLAHTSGGGLVARIPWGIDTGDRELRVSNQHGSDRTSYPIQRLAVLAERGGLTIAALAGTQPLARVASSPVADARALAISTEGALALVAGGSPPKLRFVDLTASRPAVVRTARLPGERAVAIAVASHAPRAVVLTDSHVVFIDGSRPWSPALYTPHALPPEVCEGQPAAAALSPDGKHLAIGLPRGNRAAIFSVADPTALGAPTLVALLPEVPLELLVDLRFSSDGTDLWALSGNTQRSIAGGDQPTRISIINVAGGGATSPQVIAVPAVDAPGGLAIARGDPAPPGTAIRAEPGRNAVFVAGFPSDVVARGAAALGGAKGQLVRVQRERSPASLGGGPWVPLSLDVAGKTPSVFALVVRPRGGGGEKALLVQPAWEAGAPRWLALGPLEVSPAATPLVGLLRAQP